MSADMDREVLARALSRGMSSTIRVDRFARLSGGVSRETWSVDATTTDGALLPLILRRDPAGEFEEHLGMEVRISRQSEYRLLRVAHEHGVPVPRPLMLLAPKDGLGSGFVMERMEGETIPQRILRDDRFKKARAGMARRCGEVLAGIHQITPSAVCFLPGHDATEHPASAQIRTYRHVLDSLELSSPPLELGLRWLDDHTPPPERVMPVHGDFRHGNLLVDRTGLRAVLDWEGAKFSDPMEDVGWLCTTTWRFGARDKPVGGFGELSELVSGYESVTGEAVDLERVRFWQVFGSVKWGVMCAFMAHAHRTGVRRSIELAAIGRRVCENEYDVLELLAERR